MQRDDLRNRAGELRTSQIIALRFCSDEKLLGADFRQRTTWALAVSRVY